MLHFCLFFIMLIGFVHGTLLLVLLHFELAEPALSRRSLLQYGTICCGLLYSPCVLWFYISPAAVDAFRTQIVAGWTLPPHEGAGSEFIWRTYDA